MLYCEDKAFPHGFAQMNPDTAGSFFASLERMLPLPVRSRLTRYAPFLLLLGLLVLCAFLAARLSWQFAAPNPAPASTHSGARIHNGSGAAAETPGEKIVGAHLFGRANAPDAQVAARNAPETSLDLKLAGVAAANPASGSYAIITTGNNKGIDTYAVGSKLPGGAKIRNIFPDRVVIAHNGRLETLRLPWSDLSGLGASQGAPSDKHHSGMPRSVTEQLQSHPNSLADYIRVRPYTHGKHFVGFRIYPGKKPKLFRKAGLQPGDIVTSVNGIKLDTSANSAKAMKALHGAKGPVRLSILRKGHHMTVTLNPGG